jgi:nitroreductase
MIAAATEGVDATPMEGFNADALDQLLDLPAKNLHSTSILVLGYRDAEKDYLANAPKVRRSSEELFIEMA